MDPVYTVDQIRRAEQPLLDAENHPDQLMRSAAAAVAEAAGVMLERKPVHDRYRRVLLAVGSGGNGGDALYAGAELCASGWDVDAVLLGRDARAHERALSAFTGAGGTVVDLGEVWQKPPRHRLVVDGVLGMGGSGGLSPQAATLMTFARKWFIPLLAVDVPSGIDADSGAVPESAGHVIADVTVTFGGLRRAHAVNAYCGQVVLADPGLGGGNDTIGAHLPPADVGGVGVHLQTAVAYRRAPTRKDAGGLEMSGPYDFGGTSLAPIRRARYGGPREPRPYDDKYSGGVVGICAGSGAYPGAGVLATTAAVRTTSSMVRYVGAGGPEVVRACPEVVVSPAVEDTGRVQSWVVGCGRGTDDEAARELTTLLERPEALVIDADAITLLAERRELRDALTARSDGSVDSPTALLTPHDGEFRRLVSSIDDNGHEGSIPDVGEDRIGAAVAVAERLNCGVLLKGRHTVIVNRPVTYRDGRKADTEVHTIDAGTSWGATPGSGDVLAGMLGASMAESQATLGNADHVAPMVVALQGTAAALSAKVGDGYAPTSASRIAETIPRAWVSMR